MIVHTFQLPSDGAGRRGSREPAGRQPPTGEEESPQVVSSKGYNHRSSAAIVMVAWYDVAVLS
jgi:hypothetical protein